MTKEEKREKVIDHLLKTLSDEELTKAMGYSTEEHEYKFYMKEVLEKNLRQQNRNYIYRKLSAQLSDSDVELIYKTDVAIQTK